MINYVYKYRDYMIEFDKDESYCIIETNCKNFDEYWQKHSYLNESFEHKICCRDISGYGKIINEILNNPNNEIAYPIISFVDKKGSIKISQGRHRIRAIIDSEEENIQLAIPKKYLDQLNKYIKTKIVKNIHITESFQIEDRKL